MKQVHALADEAIEHIGVAMQRAAGKGSAKVLAFKARISDEGLRKIRDGERRKGSVPTLVNLMATCPDLRAVVAHYCARFDEPTFWDLDTQRDFHRDLSRAGQRA